jgi:hypothetical protein
MHPAEARLARWLLRMMGSGVPFAFAAANPIDRHIYDIPHATCGIVATPRRQVHRKERKSI